MWIYAVTCIFPYLQLLSKLISMLLVYFWACKIALILLLDPSLLKQFLLLCCVVYCSHLPQQEYTKRSSGTSPCSLIKLISRILNDKDLLGRQSRNTERNSDRKEIPNTFSNVFRIKSVTAAAMNENPLSSKYTDQVRRLSLQLTSSACTFSQSMCRLQPCTLCKSDLKGSILEKDFCTWD